MKHALQFFGTALLVVVLSSSAFASDGVLMGDKTTPSPSAESAVVTNPGLTETALSLLAGLLYLP